MGVGFKRHVIFCMVWSTIDALFTNCIVECFEKSQDIEGCKEGKKNMVDGVVICNFVVVV